MAARRLVSGATENRPLVLPSRLPHSCAHSGLIERMTAPAVGAPSVPTSAMREQRASPVGGLTGPFRTNSERPPMRNRSPSRSCIRDKAAATRSLLLPMHLSSRDHGRPAAAALSLSPASGSPRFRGSAAALRDKQRSRTPCRDVSSRESGARGLARTRDFSGVRVAARGDTSRANSGSRRAGSRPRHVGIEAKHLPFLSSPATTSGAKSIGHRSSRRVFRA
jgi:hypothetical protein